jgi:hypothetical protein
MFLALQIFECLNGRGSVVETTGLQRCTVLYLLCGERGKGRSKGANLASGNRLSWQCTLHTAHCTRQIMVRGPPLSTSVSPPPLLYYSMLGDQNTKSACSCNGGVVQWCSGAVEAGNKHCFPPEHLISVAANDDDETGALTLW